MSNKLKIMCATLVITLMPMGSICYAKTNQVTAEEYKTIWVEPEKKEENKVEQKTMNSEEELKEISLADMLELSKDQERCKKVKGKEVCMKVIVNKVDKNDDCYYILTKDGMLKKGEFKLSKEEGAKLGNIKKGDEVLLQGTVSDLSHKKVKLENTKVLGIKEQNKDNKAKDKKEDMKKDYHKKDCDMKKKEEKKEHKGCEDKREIKPEQDTSNHEDKIKLEDKIRIEDKGKIEEKTKSEDNKIENKQ